MHRPHTLQKNFLRGCPNLCSQHRRRRGAYTTASPLQSVFLPAGVPIGGFLFVFFYNHSLVSALAFGSLYNCHHASPDIQLASLELATALPLFTLSLSLVFIILVSPLNSLISLSFSMHIAVILPPILIHALYPYSPSKPDV